LIAEPDSWPLPRKLEIAFSDFPADSSYGEFNALGFVAQNRDKQNGFRA
jgi:sulfite reductase beta subunit-like hemoprotein